MCMCGVCVYVYVASTLDLWRMGRMETRTALSQETVFANGTHDVLDAGGGAHPSTLPLRSLNNLMCLEVFRSSEVRILVPLNFAVFSPESRCLDSRGQRDLCSRLTARSLGHSGLGRRREPSARPTLPDPRA